ncbi:hypothetical protein PoMZ_05319 [Pyricularia oryzae]|uniref:Uncharacterized protein n=1 Tax=Pyricularia oryzae TaxID=318829 RepID=A0A4P7NMZ3_PYROR|nr:hypothetical protein PoMZ_05319 [Pyricularia oryzae]
MHRAVGERVENGRESSKQKLEQKHGNQRSLWIYGRRSKSVATPIATPEFLTEMQSTTGVSVPCHWTIIYHALMMGYTSHSKHGTWPWNGLIDNIECITHE